MQLVNISNSSHITSNEWLRSKMISIFEEHMLDIKMPFIDIKWSKRLTKAAGNVAYHIKKESYEIKVSYKIFSLEGFDTKKILNTLAHELTHVYICEVYGVDFAFSKRNSHGKEFQAKMTEITGVKKDHTFHSYKTPGYNMVCKSHGVVGTRTRMPRASYLCGYCKEKLMIVKK